MPSALERETAQREAAKQRTSGLTSLLEARIKPQRNNHGSQEKKKAQ